MYKKEELELMQCIVDRIDKGGIGIDKVFSDKIVDEYWHLIHNMERETDDLLEEE